MGLFPEQQHTKSSNYSLGKRLEKIDTSFIDNGERDFNSKTLYQSITNIQVLHDD